MNRCRTNRWLCFLLTVWMGMLTACVGNNVPLTETTESVSEAVENSDQSEESSLPTTEPLALIYTDYITVQTEQDAIQYTYTYCFDDQGNVFNAIATFEFPSNEEAKKNYLRLCADGYPNLELNGAQVSFAFPRRECPYYGISYRALIHILSGTVYQITDLHAPLPDDTSDSFSNS